MMMKTKASDLLLSWPILTEANTCINTYEW